jgi:alkylation response protein AidB-like acyl-CoA dehydrogenase
MNTTNTTPSPTEPTEPKKRPTAAPDEAASVIDTSKMNEGQRAALELTEAARETQERRSMVGGLFMGDCDLTGLFPFPEQNPHDREQGEAFLERLEKFLHEKVDPDAIDRTGEIPNEVIEELGRMGAFGIKIPTNYGGLGLSQTNYSRAAMLLGSHDANLTALISAHQSIGVPQPLLMFGTEEQKKKFLPRVAQGEISAFALTESGVGSDPAAMTTKAVPTADGKYFVINGEKLWCTNGVKAGVIVVMAQTPPKMTNGREKKQVTAFIVDMDTPGIEVLHRCHFMGLKALYNGVVRFRDVVVPRENIVWGEGKGLRVALSTLNTGRLTLPAACAGASKRCLRIVTKWAKERVQWGANIGKHAAIADKIARMAAQTFAMESMTLLVASMVDRDKKADIRLEAAIAKMWGTEKAWQIVDETMQIRGGRGYETADSLKARGEAPVPVERFMRDCRINTIFEGSSEIMRLFIAREMLDPHLKVSGAVLDSRKPMGERLRAGLKAGAFYASWYPRQWLPALGGVPAGVPGKLAAHLRYARRTSRRLARKLFHAMAKHGPKLEREQVLLGRFVDIGAELFAMIATCSRAAALAREGTEAQRQEVVQLADYFCESARLRVAQLFDGLKHNVDRPGYKLAQSLMASPIKPLADGIIRGDQ